MILIGLGANLPSDAFGAPRAACGAALERLERRGIRVLHRSPWYESAPVPLSDQPWFVNGVAAIDTGLGPEALVAEVLALEAEMGRLRGAANAPRSIDIDVLAHGREVIDAGDPGGVRVPHPRLRDRAFVLKPLRDVAPDWRHPVGGEHITALIAALPADQVCRPMPDADGLFGTEWRGAP